MISEDGDYPIKCEKNLFCFHVCSYWIIGSPLTNAKHCRCILSSVSLSHFLKFKGNDVIKTWGSLTGLSTGSDYRSPDRFFLFLPADRITDWCRDYINQAIDLR